MEITPSTLIFHQNSFKVFLFRSRISRRVWKQQSCRHEIHLFELSDPDIFEFQPFRWTSRCVKNVHSTRKRSSTTFFFFSCEFYYRGISWAINDKNRERYSVYDNSSYNTWHLMQSDCSISSILCRATLLYFLPVVHQWHFIVARNNKRVNSSTMIVIYTVILFD